MAAFLIPLGISFFDWAAAFRDEFGLDLPQPEGDDWMGWAVRAMELDEFSNVPRPESFTTWQDWVIRVIDVVQ